MQLEAGNDARNTIRWLRPACPRGRPPHKSLHSAVLRPAPAAAEQPAVAPPRASAASAWSARAVSSHPFNGVESACSVAVRFGAGRACPVVGVGSPAIVLVAFFKESRTE